MQDVAIETAKAVAGASEVALYSSVFAVAALAATCRATTIEPSFTIRGVVAPAGISGFLALATVSFCSYFGNWNGDTFWLSVGISALVGILGKEGDKLQQSLLRFAIKKLFGIEKTDDETGK